MGTTSNYSWPYPEATGLVKDGWEDIKDLATAIDTTAASTFGGAFIKINTTSFTSVASASLAQDTFTTTYENYLIIVNLASSGGNINIRMRASGTDATGSDYNNQQFGGDGTSASIAQTNGGTSWKAGAQAGSRSTINLWVYGPKLAQPTLLLSEMSRNVSGANIFFFGGGHNVSTAYDSLSIIDAGSSMTGKYSVYGLKF